MARERYPRRLRRGESFLGIHFDFHCGHDCTQVGRNVTRGMVERIIDRVHPDYIQCDCKGHPGISSYPTKVGYPAPGFVRDPLRIWRDVTARRGVALYMHHSGVQDVEAVKRHPSWARIDENGKRDPKNTSVFGPYADELLIPQLKELCDEYGVDGLWVDGECWSTGHDYGRKVIRAFREATGIRTVPRKPEDPHWFEFSEFCREGFRRYLAHYVDEMHRHNGDFQIASNWAYSSHMPEPAEIGVDFISGDYSLQNSVNSARFEGRCMARQGKPWDLMAWSFSGRWEDRCRSTKSVPQLQQEAAVVLSLGGGFQAYFKQKRDGSIYDWTMNLMAEVARFCRARQRICHRATPVPQVGLIYSGAAYYRKCRRLFAPWGNELTPMRGVLQALLESQYSVEIPMEHHLTGRMEEYPILIVPEWEYLEPAFIEDLRRYVRAGGRLLLIGPKAAAMFRKELGVRFVGKAEEKPQWVGHRGWLGGAKTLVQPVKLGRGAKEFGRMYPSDDNKGPWLPAASIAKCGRGRIAATYFNFGERFVSAATPTARDFLGDLVRQLFPRPMVEVTGSHNVDVAVNRIDRTLAASRIDRTLAASRIDGRLAVNLVNTSGPHANPSVYVFDEVPPVGPLQITIRTGTRPRKLTLAPAGRSLPFRFAKGKASLTLRELRIHNVILVE